MKLFTRHLFPVVCTTKRKIFVSLRLLPSGLELVKRLSYSVLALGVFLTAHAEIKLPGDEQVLATVNGSEITAYDVEHVVEYRLGRQVKDQLDDAGRENILKSLVASRAMAVVGESTMNPTQLAELDKKVNLYREELLVKYYLDRNIALEPVSESMIEDYYAEHLHEFGYKMLKRFELIKSLGSATAKMQSYWRDQFDRLASTEDWEAAAAAMNKSGYAVNYKELEADPRQLESPLKELLTETVIGTASAVIEADGHFYRLRVLSKREIPAKPLAEVRAEIRKKLSPIQLKKAVQEANEQVLQEVTVNYLSK